MMRAKGEHLGTLDVDSDGIYLMDASPALPDEKFSDDVEHGKFISED